MASNHVLSLMLVFHTFPVTQSILQTSVVSMRGTDKTSGGVRYFR